MTHRHTATTSLLLLALTVQSFDLRSTTRRTTLAASTSQFQLYMSPPPPGDDGPAGSFFHQIPGEWNDDEGQEEAGNPLPPSAAATAGENDLDNEFAELLRERRKPARASNPSTINGIPTQQTAGFGKNRPTKKKSTKPFVAVGPPDPTINDPTKPEFDDQGYTLYTDGTTGKKSRVFEALVNYPCEFTMKIVGMNEGSFVTDIVAVVAEACLEEPSSISYTTKAMGKWTSVTVQAPVKNSEMLYALYETLDRDPRVKFKF